MSTKVLFYSWDWKDRPEMKDLQRAIDAVFDGDHAPRIIDTKGIPEVNWDQVTVAVCSVPVPAAELGRLFLQDTQGDDGFWWDNEDPPTPFETAVTCT